MLLTFQVSSRSSIFLTKSPLLLHNAVAKDKVTAFQIRILDNSLASFWLPVQNSRPECGIIHSIMSCNVSQQSLEQGEFMTRTQAAMEEFLAFPKVDCKFLKFEERARWLHFE